MNIVMQIIWNNNKKSMVVDFNAPEVQQPTTRGLLLGLAYLSPWRSEVAQQLTWEDTLYCVTHIFLP